MAHARSTRAVGARLAPLSVMPRRTFWQREMRCGRGAGLGSCRRRRLGNVESPCPSGLRMRDLTRPWTAAQLGTVHRRVGMPVKMAAPGFQRGASQQQNQDRRRPHAPAPADTRRRRIAAAAARLLAAAPLTLVCIRRHLHNVQAPARPRFGPGAQAPAARAGRPRRRDRPHHDRQGRRARVGYLWRVRSGWQSRQVRYQGRGKGQSDVAHDVLVADSLRGRAQPRPGGGARPDSSVFDVAGVL